MRRAGGQIWRRAKTALLAAVLPTLFLPLGAQAQTVEWQGFSGPVVDVAIGSEGSVAVVDTAGLLSRRQSDGTWLAVSSAMVQVHISAVGEVWGLDAQARLWRFPAGLAPVEVAGGIAQFALAPDGLIYAETTAGDLGAFFADAPQWQAIDGQAALISADDQGNLWRIADDGSIAVRIAGAWIGLNGLAIDIWARGGTPLIVDPDGRVRRFEADLGDWPLVEAQQGAVVVAAGAGQLWRIDGAGQLWGAGVPAVVDPEDAGGEEGVEAGTGAGTDDGTGVVVDPAGPSDPAVDPAPYVFTRLPDARTLDTLRIGPDGSVWGTSNSGKIWRWSGRTQRFQAFPGRVNQLQIGDNDLPIVLGTEAQLVGHTGRAWRSYPTDRALYDLSVGAEGRLFALDGQGQVLTRANAASGAFTPVPLQGDRVVADPTGGVWVIAESGQLFFCQTIANCRAIAQQPVDLAVGPAGTVFTVDRSGNLFKYLRDINRFQLIRAGSVAAVAVGPGDRPWILDRTGRVFYTTLFERDEAGDAALADLSAATADVTEEVDGNAGGGVQVVIVEPPQFVTATVPDSPPGYDSLGPALNDLTVGVDDLVVVTGYDNIFTGSDQPCLRGSGQNWIYDVASGAFQSMDWLQGIILTHGFAADQLAVGFVTGTTPPAGSYATAMNAFYGLWQRDCTTPELVTYVDSVFTDPGTQVSRDFYEAVLVIEGDIDLIADMDGSADGAVANVNRERHLELFFPNDSDEIREFDKLEFARVGMGQHEEDIWVVDTQADVYQFQPEPPDWILRTQTSDDRALDVGVGFDGSVYIVNLAGVLKRWDPVLGQFTRTTMANVNRVAVDSQGRPVVANFPTSSVVYFGR